MQPLEALTPRQIAAAASDPSTFNIALAALVSRRIDLIDNTIIESAVGFRRPETERLVPLVDSIQDTWDRHADMIDAKFGAGFVGLRLVRDGAIAFHFQSDAKDTTGDSPGGAVVVRAIVMLDDLSERPLIFPTIAPGVWKHMADQLFIAWMPESMIRRNASGRGSRWDTCLRKRVAARAHIKAAALFNQQIELDAEQQQRAASQFASDLKARSDALDRAVLSDSTLRDFATGWRNWRVGARCNLGRMSKSGDDPATE